MLVGAILKLPSAKPHLYLQCDHQKYNVSLFCFCLSKPFPKLCKTLIFKESLDQGQRETSHSDETPQSLKTISQSSSGCPVAAS